MKFAISGRRGLKRAAILLLQNLITTVSLAGPSRAEPAASPQPLDSLGEQCAYAKKLDNPFIAELQDRLIVPGKRFDFSEMMKDPRAPGLTREIAQYDEARKSLDWAALCNYKQANAEQKAKGAPQVVFLGDSITENWIKADPSFFSDKIVDRGIGGQTSSQILLRFHADVVALHPAVVHLMAGTNDVAQNGGPISDYDILNNFQAMIDLAQANDIKVVLASIPPAQSFFTKPQLQPAERIVRLNDQLRRIAEERNITFVDYYTPLSDGRGGLRSDLSNDGVHPNRDGYALMKPVAEAAIHGALRHWIEGVLQHFTIHSARQQAK